MCVCQCESVCVCVCVRVCECECVIIIHKSVWFGKCVCLLMTQTFVCSSSAPELHESLQSPVVHKITCDQNVCCDL